MKKIILVSLLFLSILNAKEVFAPKDIKEYLTKENPYYALSIGKEMVKKAKELFYHAPFDTQINIKDDNKRYPATEAQYKEMNVIKPLKGGIDLYLGYRNSQGTQEYNNIKTGKNGEILAGIRIPVIAAIKQLSSRDMNNQNAKLQTAIEHQQSRENLLALYYNITALYYRVVLQKELLQTEEELLQRAFKNEQFITESIAVGKLAKVANIEIKNQILIRKQRLLESKNLLTSSENLFLRYLNLPKLTFNNRYILPQLKEKKKALYSIKESLNIAISNRPEISKLAVEVKNNRLKKEYNELLSYPKIDVSLYGAYDSIYKEGYKISLGLNMPLERSAYRGEKEVLQRERLLIDGNKRKLIIEIKTKLTNIIQEIEVKHQTNLFIVEQIDLAEQLARVEEIKLKEGIGNLIFINQRDIALVKAKQKLLSSYYELELLYLEYDYTLGLL